MEDEERELTSIKNKVEEQKTNEWRIITGSNSYKNSEFLNNEDTAKQKWSSNSDKDSPNLMSQSLGVNLNQNQLRNYDCDLIGKSLRPSSQGCNTLLPSNGRVTFGENSNALSCKVNEVLNNQSLSKTSQI